MLVEFLSRVSMPMHAERDSVMADPSVRPSVRHTLILYRNDTNDIVSKSFHHLVGAALLVFLAIPPLLNFKENSLSGGIKHPRI